MPRVDKEQELLLLASSENECGLATSLQGLA